MSTINWTVKKIKLSELVNWEKNPVKLSKEDAGQIRASLEEFGQAIPLVANAPDKKGKRRLIDGHQRKMVEMAAKEWGPDTEVNVSIPDRLLTDDECDRLSLRLRRNRGETDMMKLLANFDMDDLISVGFTESELKAVDFRHPELAEREQNIRPRKFLRILISVPVSMAGRVKERVQPLEEVDGVEVLYGAN